MFRYENNGSNERGRSMIEIIGVIFIMGLLSMGVMAGYGTVMERYRYYKFKEQIHTVSTAMAKVTANRRNFNTLKTNTKWHELNIFSNDDCVDDSCTTYRSPYGLITRDFSANADDSNITKIGLQFAGVSRHACIQLLTTEPYLISGKLVSISLNGNPVPSTPTTVSSAVSLCQDSNLMLLLIRK